MEYTQGLQLLGPFVYVRNGDIQQPSLSRKTRAILAYLAITDYPHNRQLLYTLFGQESEDPQGTLRWHLSRIRRQLSADILIVDNETVQFSHRHCHVDAFEFAQILDHQSLDQVSLDKLMQTLEAYRGEFLMGDALPDVPEFEMWLLAQRSRLEQCAQRGTVRLVEGLIENGELRAALGWAQRLVSLDPLLETAHAQLIWLYAKLGQRDAALLQYQHCRDLLQRELAVEPSDELQRLYQEILGGEVVSSHITQTTQAIVFQLQPETMPFVGREAELAQLSELWRTAQRSGTAIGLIHAEAGGGKSRLVGKFAEQQPNTLFLSGRCYESASRLPYQPWLDLLESRLQQTSDEMLSHLAPVWHTPLSRLLPMMAVRLESEHIEDSPHNMEERVMFIAVVEFLLKLPGTPAVILFLDDLQWADEASLRLFQFVAHRARDLESAPPILLLGAYRTEEADDNPAVPGFIHDLHRTGTVKTLQLSPLDINAVDSLIGQQGASTFPAGFDTQRIRDAIHQMTKGNPLYLTELIQELRNMTELPEALPIPPSLEDLVQRRLRQLSDSGRQVIEAMAVADMPTNLWVAQRISGRSEDEVFQAIDVGLRWRLLKDETGEVSGVFNFSHDLMRETVRQQLNPLRRRRLHQRSALVLSETNASAVQIAYHWREAGEVENELQYVIRAGDEAMQLQSFQAARTLYSRAAEIATEKRQRASVLINLGEVLLKLSVFDASEDCYREAHDLATELRDRVLFADSQFGLGKVLQTNSQWQGARTWFVACLKLYEEIQNYSKLAETHEAIGLTYHNEAEYPQAIEHFNAQYQIGVENDDLAAAGTAMTRLGNVYRRLNENETALNYFRDGLNILQGQTDVLSESLLLGNMAIVYVQLDEYVLAEKYFRQSLTISYDYDYMRGVANAANNLGSLNWMLSHRDIAMEYSIYSLGLGLDLKYRIRVTYSLANIVLYLNELGNYHLAEQAKKKALSLMEQVNEPHSHCQLLFEWAESLYGHGFYAESFEHNEEALEISSAIERTDIMFASQVLDFQLRIALHQLTVEDAIPELEHLLPSCVADKDKADLRYVLWKLDSSRQTDRETAAGIYHELFEHSKLEKYRARYEELTGNELPPSPSTAAVPSFVAARHYDLLDLLDRVDEVLD